MRLSYIMAAHNARSTIGAALDALTAQRTDSSFEVLVIDDGSTDETAAIAETYVGDDLRLVRLPRNIGRAAARNVGLREARAPIVAIADADDIALPTRTDAHLAAWDRNPGASLIAGAVIDVLPDGRRIDAPLQFPRTAEEVDAAFRRGRMGIPHPASSFGRLWALELGGYDESLRWCEDYDLFARGWTPSAFVPDPVAVVEYVRRGRRVDWPYWWQNERHLDAINARIRAAGRTNAIDLPIAASLATASTPPQRMRQAARYGYDRLRSELRARRAG